MAFQPQNYANIAPQGNSWVRDFIDNLTSGYKAGRLPYETGQLEQKQDLDNKNQGLLNIFQGEKNNEQVPKFNSDMRTASLAQAMQAMLNQEQTTKFNNDLMNSSSTRALQNANTNNINTLTPLDALQKTLVNKYYPQTTQANIDQQNLANKYYPKLTEAQIDSMKAMANMRNMGGSGLGVGGKEEALFQNLVKKDNPNLSPEQAYEASNVLRQGGDKLSDGTKLNQMSPASRSSFDRLTKYGSTSPLITGNIRGEQAEKEIDVLSKYAQQGLKPYGTTYLGYNPQQVMDTFKNDDASQKKLGQFIGAKQLQYEIAQNEIKLANGQPGITSTQELMDLGMQNIKASYPKLGQKAREEAQQFFVNGLKQGFEARKNVGLGASGSFNQNPSSSTSGPAYDSSAVTRVYYNGKSHLIPNDKLQDALKAGGKLNG